MKNIYYKREHFFSETMVIFSDYLLDKNTLFKSKTKVTHII